MQGERLRCRDVKRPVALNELTIQAARVLVMQYTLPEPLFSLFVTNRSVRSAKLYLVRLGVFGWPT